jgi:SAM-dependent methyltransferase
VAPENYAASFGLQWNLHVNTQLDSHSGRPISRERLFAVTDWREDLGGELVLEAGSGAGRFTEILLSTGAELYSFDFSSAVEANFRNNGQHPNLHLFQGDIYDIPLREAAFDKVLCLGVLQHTPDPEKAFRNLTRYVKPGGELVVDVYARDWKALLQWKYLLRPVTRRIAPEVLYSALQKVVPRMIPLARGLKRRFGRVGGRFVPIVEYSHLGLEARLNEEWAVLDTFDMYSPAHDHPKSCRTVARWFRDCGFIDAVVGRGPNGVIGRGRKPAAKSLESRRVDALTHAL